VGEPVGRAIPIIDLRDSEHPIASFEASWRVLRIGGEAAGPIAVAGPITGTPRGIVRRARRRHDVAVRPEWKDGGLGVEGSSEAREHNQTDTDASSHRQTPPVVCLESTPAYLRKNTEHPDGRGGLTKSCRRRMVCPARITDPSGYRWQKGETQTC